MGKKYSFKSVKGKRNYRKWADWSEGDVLICSLNGTYEDKFRNTCYEVEVIECQFDDEDAEWSEGTIVGLNSMGSLHYKLEDVPQGSVLRIEYTGKIMLEEGPYEGKEAHTCEVGIDTSYEPAAVPEAEESEEEGDYDL